MMYKITVALENISLLNIISRFMRLGVCEIQWLRVDSLGER